jgi:hypothetical protein
MSEGNPVSAPVESASEPTPVVRTRFSLTEGDRVNQVFGLLGLGGRRPLDLLSRSLLLILLTWIPLAILAWWQGLYSARVEGSNFFADFAAYAQFLFALPLFVVAESIVSLNTREAAKAFFSAGIIPARLAPRVDALHRMVARRRRSGRAELFLLAIAYALALLTIGPELCLHRVVCVIGADTWHSQTLAGQVRLTYAGWYAMLVALPLLNYWWLRWAWKILIWTHFLYRVTRFRLLLVASHPDHTGGIGFISRVQAKFGWIIFAYGISNVAAVVAYKVAIEGADLAVMSVWGPMVGFTIGAPLLFTLPLFMFTKQLFRTKKRALSTYRRLAMNQTRLLEKHWLNIGRTDADARPFDLEQQTSFGQIFESIERMRVVPFDFRSMAQLFGSTLGSVATVLPLLSLETPLATWLQAVASFLSAFR